MLAVVAATLAGLLTTGIAGQIAAAGRTAICAVVDGQTCQATAASACD